MILIDEKGKAAMYIVSACLLGEKCKYDGGHNRAESVMAFLKNKKYVMICPEVLGDLDIPRPPAEISDNLVIDINGRDVTSYFVRGTLMAMTKIGAAKEDSGEEIEGAILKSNSPSCGKDLIYDGTFTGNKITGDGIFARQLKKRNIEIMTEQDITRIMNIGDNK